MDAANNLGLDDIEVDINNLYRDELITDRKVAQLRRMIPITIDGTDDSSRAILYTGTTQIMLPAGPLPITADIDAATLEEALNKFPDAIKKAVEEMISRVQEMQREEANRIVTPNEFAGGKGGAGGLII